MGLGGAERGTASTVVNRSHRDHFVVERGGLDGVVLRASVPLPALHSDTANRHVGVVAAVACGGHQHDPEHRSGPQHQLERIRFGDGDPADFEAGLVAGRRARKRHVDHIGSRVHRGGHRLRDRQRAASCAAGGREAQIHPHGQDLRLRCHPGHMRVGRRRVVFRGDDAGHMGAVTVEVLLVAPAQASRRDLVVQVVMVDVHAGVEHRDGHLMARASVPTVPQTVGCLGELRCEMPLRPAAVVVVGGVIIHTVLVVGGGEAPQRLADRMHTRLCCQQLAHLRDAASRQRHIVHQQTAPRDAGHLRHRQRSVGVVETRRRIHHRDPGHIQLRRRRAVGLRGRHRRGRLPQRLQIDPRARRRGERIERTITGAVRVCRHRHRRAGRPQRHTEGVAGPHREPMLPHITGQTRHQRLRAVELHQQPANRPAGVQQHPAVGGARHQLIVGGAGHIVPVQRHHPSRQPPAPEREPLSQHRRPRTSHRPQNRAIPPVGGNLLRRRRSRQRRQHPRHRNNRPKPPPRPHQEPPDHLEPLPSRSLPPPAS